jgi:SAM-dependent methyltransferase
LPGVAQPERANPDSETRSAFWAANQPGFRFVDAEIGTPAFFEDVERHRYTLEPHIRDVVDFPRWRDMDVLEAGCGIGTDGVQFARAGARYTGIDWGESTLELARRHFALKNVDGTFAQASVTELPYPDASFDLVYSHGVIHHIPDTERAVAEFHRVLRPGGTALVMLYHRGSLNYHVSIMLLRRALVALLAIPKAPDRLAPLLGERPEVLEGHRELLRTYGSRYLFDGAMFLSRNTDGPGNPLSKVYSRDQARRLFAAFADVRVAVRYLNLRLYPGGSRLAATALARRLERRFGWHLYVEARKGGA